VNHTSAATKNKKLFRKCSNACNRLSPRFDRTKEKGQSLLPPGNWVNQSNDIDFKICFLKIKIFKICFLKIQLSV